MNGLNQHKKDIGKRIKLLRGPYSQAAFAEMIKISLPSLQRYEYGHRIPPGPVLEELADISGRPVEWILTGNEASLFGVKDEDVPVGMDDDSLKILRMINRMDKYQKREVLRIIKGQKLRVKKKKS